MTEETPRRGPTRRGVLLLAGAGALGVAGLAGGGALLGRLSDAPQGTMTPERRDTPRAAPRDALRRMTTVAGAAYVDEPQGRRAAWWGTPALVAQLDRWLRMHVRETGVPVDTVRSYGAWVPRRDGLWHSAGRAFDIAALSHDGAPVVSARRDQWRTESAARIAHREGLYWRMVAGLHTEFADVLTYLHDEAHASHVHVDNGRFGEGGRPRFIERSRAQNESVQAMLRHVWGHRDIDITGRYDDATRKEAARVIREHGTDQLGSIDPADAELTDGVEAWRAFMLATLRHRTV